MAAEGAYPYQAAIDAYGNGGFRFAGMSHRGSLLCLPNGMYAWDVTSPAELTLERLEPVMAVSGDLDVLMIGLGPDIAALPRDIRDAFRDKGVIIEAIATGPAVRDLQCALQRATRRRCSADRGGNEREALMVGAPGR